MISFVLYLERMETFAHRTFTLIFVACLSLAGQDRLVPVGVVTMATTTCMPACMSVTVSILVILCSVQSFKLTQHQKFNDQLLLL